MSFSASDVKKLREMTGAGMMACKNALKETDGDMDGAVDFLRKKGLAAAEKKQSRVAAEGTIALAVEGNKAVAVEVNCETDFVSKGDDFQNFAKSVAQSILKDAPADINVLKDAKASDVNELTLKLGEKIDIRRFETVEVSNGTIGEYNHGGRIGVLVAVEGSTDSELAKDLSMHVAAADPKFVSSDDIDENFKKKEADVYRAQLIEQGKPENMLDKIVDGKLKKLASEVCLLEQKFIKDPDTKVSKLVGDANVTKFVKLNLGEGIEKKEDNLADEVAKMTGQQ